MAITSSASGIARIEEILGEDAEQLLGHECTTIPRDRLHLPGPDFVDRVMRDSDRSAPVLRSLQSCSRTAAWAAPATSRSCRSTRASSIGGRVVRQEPRLLRPGEHRQARDRGRLQRRRLDARRAGRGLAQVRAPDPVHAQAQPQRVPELPERVRPDHVRQVKQARDMGAVGRRRDDLLRLGGVEAADRRGLAGVRSTRTSSAWRRCCGATCATPPSRPRTAADYHIAADLTGQANHLGVTIEADIIKQKLPEVAAPGFTDRQLRQDRQARLQRADDAAPDRHDPLPGGELLHGPRGPDQLGRRVAATTTCRKPSRPR